MKNQNDLIVSIVAGVIGIGIFVALIFTQRTPVKPAPPTSVPTAEAQLQPGAVTFANSLPGGSSQTGGPAAPAGGGGGGGGFRRKSGGAAGMAPSGGGGAPAGPTRAGMAGG